MFREGNIILCPMCGDDLVKATSPRYMEHRRDGSYDCQWYKCDPCNYEFKYSVYITTNDYYREEKDGECTANAGD